MDPESVASVMNRVGVWWGIAGGWAIDLWLGRETRLHHDVEVVVRRCDQHRVHARLAGEWELFAIDPPGSGWQPWQGVTLELPAVQIQARAPFGEFDLFTESIDESKWHFRRDRRIVCAAEDVLISTPAGIPLVRPEIQLLYMATSADPKNQHDFGVAAPHLPVAAAAWLRDALEITLPGHRWLQWLP